MGLRITAALFQKKERGPGMLEFNQVSKSCVEEIIGKAWPQTAEQTQYHPN